MQYFVAGRVKKLFLEKRFWEDSFDIALEIAREKQYFGIIELL